jgi:hypothetical protein
MKLCLRCSLLGLLLLAASTSCGGKSAEQASESPGSSAQQGGAANVAGGAENGGAASTSAGAENGGAATAGAGPVSTSCPAATPVNNTSCNYSGNQCNYAVDMCSSIGFVCQNGVWQQQSNNDGAALTCENYADPSVRPKDGDSCACRGMLDCTFDDCSAQGSAQAQSTHAVCDNTSWHVTAAPCNETPCGSDGLRCATGEACVVHPDGIKADYQCVADPCAAQAQTLSCDCASSVCHSPAERCMLNNGVIACICDAC